MIHLHQSDSLTELFSKVCRSLKNPDETRSPLQPDHFILPNNDMGRWLQIHLADELGISANLVLEMPSSYMRMLYELKDADYAHRLADKEALNWIIYDLLHNYSESQPELTHVQQYIDAGGKNEAELRRWQMAVRISDIFDQYIIYRPDWISAWAQNQQPEECRNNPHATWQMWIWHQISRNYPGLKTRAGLQAELLQEITTGNMDSILPRKLFVFGIPLMAPVFVQTITEIAKRGVEVDWFRVIPAKNAVLDTDINTETANPLIFGMARECIEAEKVIRETIQSTDAEYDSHDCFTTPSAESLLQHLQGDLLANTRPEPSKSLTFDSSLIIHSCHNPLREVEVVYEQILEYLNTNPDRGPGDILVVTPDIDKYAPFIEGVFTGKGEQDKALPYTLSGELADTQGEILTLVNQIISVASGRFKITDVFELLDAPLIREKFGFDIQDVTLLEKWAAETNIRWGWDQEHHDGEYQNSWRFGLDRMLAGLAYENDRSTPVQQILPYGEIEGGGAMNLLGSLHRLLDQLNQIRLFLRKKHSAGVWVDKLGGVLNSFFPENEDTADAIQVVREQLQSLKNHTEQWKIQGDYPFEIIREWLAGLSGNRMGMGFRSGKITCSAMVPVRNMPFSFIAVLGVNEQDIPARDTFSGFDLMGQIKRPGDRSRRNQDRSIFLDTIMAAKDRLHLSFTGRNQKDNNDIPPSTLVTELLEYLDQHYEVDEQLPSEVLLHRHRLYGFDPQYLSSETGNFFTYSRRNEQLANLMREQPGEGWYPADQSLETPDNNGLIELSVRDLIRFFQKPAGQLLREQLEVRLLQEQIITEDRDPWVIYGLSDYRIRQQLLDSLLSHQTAEDVFNYFRADGLIPRGKAGVYHYDRVSSEVRSYVDQLTERELVLPYLEEVGFDHVFEVDGFRIRLFGKLEHLTAKGNLFIMINRENPKYRMMAWMYHLVTQLAVTDESRKDTTLVMRDKRKSQPVTYSYKPVEDSAEHIRRLLSAYLEGMRKPFSTYPKASHEFVNEMDQSGNEAWSLQKATDAFFGTPFNPYPDASDDPAIGYLFNSVDPMQCDEFKKWSLALWSPLKEHEVKV